MRYLVIVFIAMLTVLLVFLLLRNQESYFKTVDLVGCENIENRGLPKYYDTILCVALSNENLSHHKVVVIELSSQNKLKFEGRLKANLRYVNGDFYLFIDVFDRNKAINVISHEVVHMLQYSSKKLVYNNNTGELFWNGSKHSLDVEYENRPWEIEAFENQGRIQKRIYSVLY